MIKIKIVLLLVVLFQLPVLAQEKGTGYSNAVRLIDSGRQVEAMDELRPYLDYKNYGNLSLYARYHFARAAYKNRQFQLAQVTLEQLLGEYDWEKKDEAHYLLALSYFGQNEAYAGLNALREIHGEGMRMEGEKASYAFLRKDMAVSFMVAHWTAFKNNKGYAKALEEKLLEQAVLTSNEKQVLKEIQDQKFDGDSLPSSERVINDVLDIAVILPFNYQGGSGVRDLKSNNFVFELYQGIDMAIQDAQNRGLEINIRTFDTERKDVVIRKVLEDPYFQYADVIIGPIYPEETELVASFAKQNHIPFINPVSNIADGFEGNDYAYLFRPSTKAIVERLLEYGQQHNLGKRIALAYSGATKDELMAREFVEEARRRGYSILFNKKVNSTNIRKFLQDIGIRAGGKVTEVDQVVILSDDPYIASPTLALLESLTTDTPIFVMDSWLFFNFANFDLLEGNNINYMGNNTVNWRRKEVEDFRFRFFEEYFSYPGSYAYVGYDLMSWVTDTINSRKGFDFRGNLNQRGEVAGSLSFGLDFRNSQFNQYVPVLQLNGGKLEEIK